MAEVAITVTGLEQLRKGLDGLQGRRLRKVSRKVLTSVGKDAKKRALRRVTGSVLDVRSGGLKRSIDFDVDDFSVGVLAGKAAKSAVVWEWRDKDGPRRFLRPSLEEAATGLERKFIQEWEREIFRGVK